MRQEIDDPRKYRVSMSGFSIKTGWGDEKKIVAKYPGRMHPLDKDAYQQWLSDAEKICEQYNATLTPNALAQGAGGGLIAGGSPGATGSAAGSTED